MEQLKVRVTKEDIRAGKAKNGIYCPIARALRRKGLERVSVGPFTAQIGRRKELYDLSEGAADFVYSFDKGLPVKPSIFILTKESD